LPSPVNMTASKSPADNKRATEKGFRRLCELDRDGDKQAKEGVFTPF